MGDKFVTAEILHVPASFKTKLFKKTAKSNQVVIGASYALLTNKAEDLEDKAKADPLAARLKAAQLRLNDGRDSSSEDDSSDEDEEDDTSTEDEDEDGSDEEQLVGEQEQEREVESLGLKLGGIRLSGKGELLLHCSFQHCNT